MSLFFLYLSFLVYSKHVAFLLIVFLPIALFAAFFAIPWGRDQPTEVWALAKLKYLIYPHNRVWNQSGVKNLVQINAPKRVKINYTNGLSRDEVQSRLKVLAETIDTRGWATKNVNVNLSTNQSVGPTVIANEDRLTGTNAVEEAPVTDINLRDDILDEKNNTTAFKFTEKIKESEERHRQALIESTKNIIHSNTPENKWFSQNQVSGATSTLAQVDTGFTPEQEREINQELHQKHDRLKQEYNSHIKYIKTPEELEQDRLALLEAEKARQAMMTHTPSPDIINMASNNDLSVAAIQHEGEKTSEGLDGEVVINLH